MREGKSLNELTEDQRKWWCDEVLKSIYGSKAADDTQALTLGGYPSIATTHTLTSEEKVARTQIFLTDRLIITIKASNSITSDGTAKDRALLFLRSLTVN